MLENRSPRASVRGAGFYFKNTRLFPVPSYVFRTLGSDRRSNSAYSLIPRLSFNSADGLLLTSRLSFPLAKEPERLSLSTDLGVSSRVGFRGGLALESRTDLGTFALRARRADIITNQLTNRIEVDRAPEVEVSSPLIPLFHLPGGRMARMVIGGSAGEYTERSIDDDNHFSVRSSRQQATVALTTRSLDVEGPYLQLVARVAHYPGLDMNYRNFGVEVGYEGSITRLIRGTFSYRTTSLSGETPFRFDRVEIARELRTTFDVQATPRYLVPIDLRYDLDQRKLRDQRFGLLRSYKNFAYGVTYQTAHRELQVEFRNGF